MSAQTLPGAGPEPAGTPQEPRILAPAPAPPPMLPRSHDEEPAGGWPRDVHLPDEKEDDEC